MHVAKSLLIVTSLFATSAFAQETAAPEPSEAPAQVEATPTTPEPGAPGPTETIAAVHGDWQIRCREGNDTCFMYTLAHDAKDAPVAEMSIVALKNQDGGVAGFTLVTPLKSMLPAGVALQVDNGKLQRYPYRWCAEMGCFVRFGLDAAGLKQYKRGSKARLTVMSVDRPDAPIVLDISLKGFTAAFDALAEM